MNSKQAELAKPIGSKLIIINISTSDMYENFTNKIICCGKPSNYFIEKIKNIEEFLTNGNVEGIRIAFLEGYAEYFLTYEIQQITEICSGDCQINIFHSGNLICSLVNQEINFGNF